MRQGRVKAPRDHCAGWYHCLSRVVDGQFIFGDAEKEMFVKLMREYEAFCGVQVLTHNIMSNHFHIVLHVPRRPEPEELPTDEELLKRLEGLSGTARHRSTRQILERLRKQGQHQAAEEVRERYLRRMWDVSEFMKALKERFTQWYNRWEGRRGTLWEGRFKSVLVEGVGEALASVAAYVDLNSIRANLADKPEEYRWCGYAEAMAGKAEAIAGLRMIVAGAMGVAPETLSDSEVLAQYRKWLYQKGEENEKADPSAGPSRRGFSREEVAKVAEADGQVSLAEFLRLRVRYFADGAVLGTQAFVDGVFRALRSRFGPRRKEGAQAMKGLGSTQMYVLQKLRKRPPVFS